MASQLVVNKVIATIEKSKKLHGYMNDLCFKANELDKTILPHQVKNQLRYDRLMIGSISVACTILEKEGEPKISYSIQREIATEISNLIYDRWRKELFTKRLR